MRYQPIALLAVAGYVLADTQSGGEVTAISTISSYYTTSASSAPTGPWVPTSGFTSTVITEASHTETVPIPMGSIPTSGFTSTVIVEASHTETMPIPIAPSASSEAAYVASSASGGSETESSGTSAWASTSPYIPPNPPVPSSGFTSTVISEAGATETIPVPVASYSSTPTSYGAEAASGTATSYSGPAYTGGAAAVATPVAEILAAGAIFAVFV